MWKKIKPILIAFISGIGFGLLVIIGRGKSDTAGTLKERVNRNNTDIRSGLDRSGDLLDGAREVNTGLGNINDSALSGIEDTRNTVSDIIGSASRNRRATDTD